ncbi:kelch repeat-containing protein [Flavobacterium sp.]|uniref:kelch repeat-containing protein n=1 Tax=Flavobacterium sp. TaxID=239 RepID=UPI00286F455D|nr:kelch repeat-containing protein [Flavobacterium sp.]
MNRLFCIFSLFLLHTSICQAQFDQYKGDYFLFQDAKTRKTIVIEHDSLYQIDSQDRLYRLKHTNYPEIISRYNTFKIKGKNYFAHNGCGPVLEWRNDSLVRIDNSFLHQNQYGAASFVYKNEFYYFGGYGLFTFKNLLTKYIFKSREWMAVQTFGDELPSLRRDANRILIGDYLYIFGGLVENPDNFYYGEGLSDSNVWKLDLKKMKWNKEGVFDSKYNSLDGYFNFQNGKKTYLLSRGANNKLLEIDIEANTIKKYILPSLINVKSFYFDEKSNDLVVLHLLSTTNQIKVIHIPLNTITKTPISSEAFIINPLKKLYTFLFIGCSLLLVSFVFLKTKVKTVISDYNSLIFDTTKNQLRYKRKNIGSIDDNELKIISFLVDNQTKFIALNTLNELFEQDELSENYTSTIKRRENTLNNLITKLSLITGYKENEILDYRKNPDDKRVKEIKLKENIIRIK